MILKLTNRSAEVNAAIDAILGNRYTGNCHYCMLSGTTELSQQFYKILEEKGIDATRPCSRFHETLEELGYTGDSTTDCVEKQHQALALYLLLSKPKEKRK